MRKKRRMKDRNKCNYHAYLGNYDRLTNQQYNQTKKAGNTIHHLLHILQANGSLFYDDGDSLDTVEAEAYLLTRYVIVVNQRREADQRHTLHISLLSTYSFLSKFGKHSFFLSWPQNLEFLFESNCVNSHHQPASLENCKIG